MGLPMKLSLINASLLVIPFLLGCSHQKGEANEQAIKAKSTVKHNSRYCATTALPDRDKIQVMLKKNGTITPQMDSVEQQVIVDRHIDKIRARFKKLCQ